MVFPLSKPLAVSRRRHLFLRRSFTFDHFFLSTSFPFSLATPTTTTTPLARRAACMRQLSPSPSLSLPQRSLAVFTAQVISLPSRRRHTVRAVVAADAWQQWPSSPPLSAQLRAASKDVSGEFKSFSTPFLLYFHIALCIYLDILAFSFVDLYRLCDYLLPLE